MVLPLFGSRNPIFNQFSYTLWFTQLLQGWEWLEDISGVLLLYYRQSVGSYFHSLMWILTATLSAALVNPCIVTQVKLNLHYNIMPWKYISRNYC